MAGYLELTLIEAREGGDISVALWSPTNARSSTSLRRCKKARSLLCPQEVKCLEQFRLRLGLVQGKRVHVTLLMKGLSTT